MLARRTGLGKGPSRAQSLRSLGPCPQSIPPNPVPYTGMRRPFCFRMRTFGTIAAKGRLGHAIPHPCTRGSGTSRTGILELLQGGKRRCARRGDVYRFAGLGVSSLTRGAMPFFEAAETGESDFVSSRNRVDDDIQGGGDDGIHGGLGHIRFGRNSRDEI